MAAVVSKDYPDLLPTEAIKYLVGILTGATKDYNFREAVKNAYDVIGYLLGKVFAPGDDAAVAAVTPKAKFTKKKLADSLSALCDPKAAAVGGAAAWLIPALIELALKWLANRK